VLDQGRKAGAAVLANFMFCGCLPPACLLPAPSYFSYFSFLSLTIGISLCLASFLFSLCINTHLTACSHESSLQNRHLSASEHSP
jgi:hypothetical protein